MLTTALSKIFLYAFILLIIVSIGDIISQITLKPIEFKKSKGSSSLITLGTPGLAFNAQIKIQQHEKVAPDTSVHYSYTRKGSPVLTGYVRINKNDFYNTEEELTRLIELGEVTKLDTQVTFIGELKREKIGTSTVMLRLEETDTSSKRREADKVSFFSRYNTSNKISEERFGRQKLRILPAKNTWQQFVFVFYRLIQIISFAFIFLILSRLFKNFHNRNYFTYHNVSLLKKLGWYILIPQIINMIFYWAFLRNIHPLKIFVSYNELHKVRWLKQYEFDSGIDWQLSFVGLGIIVLSHIFKDGLKMKEEQQLTV